MEGERLADAELMQTNAVAPRNFDLLMGHATAAASSPMSNVGGGFGGGGFGGTSPQPAVGSILEQAMQRVSNNYHHAPAAAAFAVVPPAPMGGGMAPLPQRAGRFHLEKNLCTSSMNIIYHTYTNIYTLHARASRSIEFDVIALTTYQRENERERERER